MITSPSVGAEASSPAWREAQSALGVQSGMRKAGVVTKTVELACAITPNASISHGRGVS